MAIIALALIAAAVGVGATRALFLDTGSGSGNQITSDFIIAFDDLESGGFAGGFGWLDSWAPTGAATVTSANTPYEGTYHLEVDKGAEVVRSLDLSGETLMRLQFRGKVTSLTGNRQGHAEVSSDGVVWNVVRTWTSADPGGVYQYEDIDLSPYTMSSQFWVKFKLDGGGGNRLLHVDNVTYASRQALPATPTPTATPIPPPAPPTNLVATPGNAQVALNWDDNTEPDLNGYNVYRSTTPGGPYTKVNGALVAVSDYADTGLTNGTTYYYVVRAENTSALESGNSNEASATPIDAPPAAPTGLVATPASAQVSLDWADNAEPDLAGYNVYRSTSTGGPYTKVNGALVTVSNYTDTGLTNGTTYYYVVRAEDNGTNESGNSSEVSATPAALPPAAPTGLVATAGDLQISLNWDDNTEPDLAGYNVYRSTATGGQYTKVNGALVTVSDYSDTGLISGVTYYYVVRAENTSTQESGNSNEASATPYASLMVSATADSYVDQKKAGNSHGTAVTMIVKAKSNQNMRSFVQFDISSIPAGSTVSSATLALCATSVPGTRTYDVHSVSATWGETTITWTNQPGVAASPTASNATPASPGCMTWTVTVDVQAWVDGTTNNGWRISDSAENTGNAQTDFRSREDTAVPADNPKLDVQYTAP